MTAVPAPETGPDAGAVWHYGDPLGEQRAADADAVVVDRSHRAVLTLTGGDRQRWLHSISTQHVERPARRLATQNLSLDGQGRVEDHWIQTDLGGVTYLDTEPWRAEPLLAYLRKMVFWADVKVELPTSPCCRCSAPDSPTRRCSMRSASIRYQLKRPRYRCPDGGFVRRIRLSEPSSWTSWCRVHRPPTGWTG